MANSVHLAREAGVARVLAAAAAYVQFHTQDNFIEMEAAVRALPPAIPIFPSAEHRDRAERLVLSANRLRSSAAIAGRGGASSRDAKAFWVELEQHQLALLRMSDFTEEQLRLALGFDQVPGSLPGYLYRTMDHLNRMGDTGNMAAKTRMRAALHPDN